jgi:hypothetical protein
VDIANKSALIMNKMKSYFCFEFRIELHSFSFSFHFLVFVLFYFHIVQLVSGFSIIKCSQFTNKELKLLLF